jgi:hypothetical protein
MIKISGFKTTKDNIIMITDINGIDNIIYINANTGDIVSNISNDNSIIEYIKYKDGVNMNIKNIVRYIDIIKSSNNYLGDLIKSLFDRL